MAIDAADPTAPRLRDQRYAAGTPGTAESVPWYARRGR